MKFEDLETYRRELLQDHEHELAALDRLIARERANSQLRPQRNGSISTEPGSNQRPIGVPSGVSITDKILKAAAKFSGNFTSAQVFGMLNNLYPSESWVPRAVSRTLWRLGNEGKLRTVQKGEGTDRPAVYANLSKEQVKNEEGL